MHTRRKLLHLGAALAGTSVTAKAWAQNATTNVRRLSFETLYTGEKLSVDYWVDGEYVADALAAVNVVLRDYWNNEVHVIEPGLLDLLSHLHQRLGSTAPFRVISGYRSPATNAMLHEHDPGVAVHSLHMKGMAIDIRLQDRALHDLHRTAVALRGGGVGFYPDLDFVHVDVGRVRYWGD